MSDTIMPIILGLIASASGGVVALFTLRAQRGKLHADTVKVGADSEGILASAKYTEVESLVIVIDQMRERITELALEAASEREDRRQCHLQIDALSIEIMQLRRDIRLGQFDQRSIARDTNRIADAAEVATEQHEGETP